MSFWSTDFWAPDFWADDFWTGLAGGAPATGKISRRIGAINQAEAATAASLHEVIMVALGFDVPVFVHSGFGNLLFNGDTYVGVGQLGAIGQARETEVLGPTPLQLTLSGVDAALIGEALNAGNFGDDVTIYVGYRQDDGTFLEAPWVVWSGWFENATITLGSINAISVQCQHDLSVLSESDGGRYTDEDHQRRFTSDSGFQFVADMATLKLVWAGGPVSTGGGGGGGGDGQPMDQR